MKKQIRNLIFLLTVFFMLPHCLFSQIVKGYAALGSNLAQVDGDEAYGFYKFGLNTGLGAEIQLSKLFSASIEANFNQKGARKFLFKEGYKLNINYVEVPIMFFINDGAVKFGVGFSYSTPIASFKEYDPRIRIDTTDNESYIAVYNKTSDIMSYNNFIINSPETDNSSAYFASIVKPWNEEHNKFNKNTFSIIASITFKIWKQLKCDIRYSYTLNKIRTVDYYFYKGINFDNTNTQYNIYSDGDYVKGDFFECFQRKEHHNCLTFRILYYFNEKQVEKIKEKQATSGGELRN